jgi:hypothetical protein
MNSAAKMGWASRLLIGLVLVMAGAAIAVWALARYDKAAQFLGVTTVQPVPVATQSIEQPLPAAPVRAPTAPVVLEGTPTSVAELEARLARVERTTRMAAGSAGRADALIVAFAARRAIDRGAPLGFLENLLVDRFGAQQPKIVATVISAAREPVRRDQLIEEYEALGPELRGSGPSESWWAGFGREFGSLIEIRRADAPSTKPETRYRRAADRLETGDVEGALAETMRLPGAAAAGAWTAKARRYIAAHRALDELEAAALMGGFSGR